MSRTNQILLVGREREVLDAVRSRLTSRGHDVTPVSGTDECLRLFSAEGAGLVIACLPLVGEGGTALLRGLRGLDPRLNVVVAGRDEEILGAADAFSADAFEYVDDPIRDIDDMLAAVGSALGSRRGDVQLRYLKRREASSSSWSALVGASEEMRAVVELLRRLCERTGRGAPPTILVSGETGTGKGLLAKCIHYNGPRRNQAFVDVNCAAIPDTLLESELFGHERGAFTDARTSSPGLFETAHTGTLFLDEIKNLSLELQAKLLKAIEEKTIRRLGARQSTQVDVQIIAACQTDLAERVRAGKFRADLYHRLNVVSVKLPPLRHRGDDKLVLARTFIEQTCREYGISPRRLGSDAERYIREYQFPGNVRELKNQIERAIFVGADEVLERRHLELPSLPPPASDRRGFTLTVPDEGIGLDEVERELIRRALDRFDGDVGRAAEFLKVSQQSLVQRMRKHDMTRPAGSS